MSKAAQRMHLGSLRLAIPKRWRRPLRLLVNELPHRLRDFPADVRDRLRLSVNPLPPAQLRRRVSKSSSRREFREAGALVSRNIIAAYRDHSSTEERSRWLDFGCGSGRVATHILESGITGQLSGVDIDEEAVRWLARHEPRGHFAPISAAPPVSLDQSSFDVIYCISVFTHFDQALEKSWLTELARLLAPGGLLIASTISPKLSFERQDLSAADREVLDATGYLFAPGLSFNEKTTFQTRERLEDSWGPVLDLLAFQEFGLARYQDLSIWRSRKPKNGACG